jgi:hypothetical protein
MFKKKQARFSVSVPYELRENKLWIQLIAWPEQCPCCNEKESAALGTYKYKHGARYSQTSTGTQTTTTSFPLEWEVPYCQKCQEHVNTAENWRIGIVAFCIFVPIILVLAIDASSTILALVMYAVFIMGGLALYKIIVETVVKPKQKPNCLDYNLAFWASSPPTEEHRIIFNFDREEYAQNFAAMNLVEMEINAS